MKLLVINAGSSSLKFRLYEMPAETALCEGLVERIGTADAFIKCQVSTAGKAKKTARQTPVADHAEAVKEVLAILTDPADAVIKEAGDIKMVAHRVVHGGEQFTEATLVTPEVKATIVQLFSIAPLHNPVNYRCIEVTEHFFPAAKQAAVFDTAFHQTLPDKAFRYAIPASFYTKEQIRVYGFHGTSHKYVTEQAAAWLKKPDAKMISIHLGNGCSMAAVAGNRSIDTSMGFSPLNGLVMGTRSGEIDPSVLLHLINKLGMNADRINSLLNKQSGLVGLCGMNDMRDIRKAINAGDAAAAFACELYTYRIKKYIGAYAAILNGLDAVIFTAGVGENDADIREAVSTQLEFLGIHLDAGLNRQHNNGIYEISKTGSPVKLLVIPTNEELEIARQSFGLMEG